MLDLAIQRFLDSIKEDPKPLVLWSLKYTQLYQPSDVGLGESVGNNGGILKFPDSSPDLAFEDSIFENVRTAWQRISGQTDGFMNFDDREVGAYDDDEE